MAIEQINSADYDYEMMLDTLNYAYKGKADITIDEYDTTAAPDVKVGSVFDNNGALLRVITADETPTGYSGIANSTTFYLYYDESEEEFIYSSTAPTWSDTLQGWYNSNDRAFFSMYKDSGGTLYQNKGKLKPQAYTPEYGGVGSIVIAASNTWSTSTEYLPTLLYSGSALYRTTYSPADSSVQSLNAIGNTMGVDSDSWVSLGLSGTWMLLKRVYKGTDSTYYPVGLFQRVS